MFKRNVVNKFTTNGEEVLFSSYAKKVNLSLYSLGITHNMPRKTCQKCNPEFLGNFFFSPGFTLWFCLQVNMKLKVADRIVVATTSAILKLDNKYKVMKTIPLDMVTELLAVIVSPSFLFVYYILFWMITWVCIIEQMRNVSFLGIPTA